MADKEKTLKQIDRIAQKLDEQTHKAEKAKTTAVVIGLIFFVFLLGYFYWASTQVKKLLNPQDVASMASDAAMTQVKEYSPKFQAYAKEKVPGVVDRLVDELITEQLPLGRKALEDNLKEQTDLHLASMTDSLIDQFDMVMDTHKENVQVMVEQLKTPEGTKAFQEDMYNRLNEVINDENILLEIDTYGTALADIHKNLEFLVGEDPETLTGLHKATFDLLAVSRELASRSKLSISDLPTFEGVDEAMGLNKQLTPED